MAKKQRSGFAARLRETAMAAGKTSEEMAELLGVGASTVRGWWNDHSKAPIELLPRYAELTGTSVEYLVTGRDLQMEFAEMVREGVDPWEAVERLAADMADRLKRTLPPIPTEKYLPLLLGAGEEMRAALEEQGGDQWARLTKSQRQALLQLIRTIAESSPPTSDAEENQS